MGEVVLEATEMANPVPAGNGARVLIVDDSKTNLLKMGLAVKHLGHEALCKQDGSSALETLAQENIDIMLLDIVMPGMSGFDVLKAMKSNDRLRDIPVIVISSLDDDMDSVVRAIELGADDFLPKDFNPVLLKARASAGVERKRLRDLELEYLGQVNRLTKAAAVLAAGSFNPSKLGIHGMAERNDGLGKLAEVFLSMAQQVYERERTFRTRIATLRGGFLLLAIGALYGLLTPLSRIASFSEAHPWTLSFWINSLGSIVLIAATLLRGRWKPVPRMHWTFLILVGAIGSLAEILLFSASAHLPASTVTMILAMDSFIVFAFASMAGFEATDRKRFLGLFLGVSAVCVIIVSGQQISGAGTWVWYLVALAVPVLYALYYVLIATRMPAYLDISGMSGIIMAISAAIALPVIWFAGDLAATAEFATNAELMSVILMMTTIVTLGGVLTFVLTKTTGAVFASQCSYAITFFGITWSLVLLRESITIWSWIALSLVVLGLVIVGPKREAELEIPVELRV